MRSIRLFLFLGAVGLLCNCARAETVPLREDGPGLVGQVNPLLSGVDKLYVVIAPLDTEAAKEGLIWEQLQKKIEHKLGKAGISTVAAGVFDTGIKAYEIPELRVYINILKLGELQQVVFRIQTSLSRAVHLMDRRQPLFKADVWRTDTAMQIVPQQDMAAAVTEQALEQVEAFIQACLAANTKDRQARDAGNIETVAGLAKKATNQTEQSTPAEYKYVSSKNSKVFHKSDCQWVGRIKQENLVSYSSRDQAIEAGKRPCKQCNP